MAIYKSGDTIPAGILTIHGGQGIINIHGRRLNLGAITEDIIISADQALTIEVLGGSILSADQTGTVDTEIRNSDDTPTQLTHRIRFGKGVCLVDGTEVNLFRLNGTLVTANANEPIEVLGSGLVFLSA